MKLGLIKIFAKAMNKESEGFMFKAKFSTYKRGQDKRRHFCRSSSKTEIEDSRL